MSRHFQMFVEKKENDKFILVNYRYAKDIAACPCSEF